MNIPDYTIIRELGQGGMANVYLARQDSLGRNVALKVMKPLAVAGDDFITRFIKEGQIIAQLQHPQIVTIHDFKTSDGLYYFSMEYLPGETLSARIRRRALSTAEALTIARRIAEALAVAHKHGVIHRDVKPQNILFRDDGTPVLTDFGIARSTRSSAESMQLTSLGTAVGSPPYMSPEQCMGQSIDARSDLYSLGIVLYEMLTGELPYQADDPITLAMKHCTAPIPRLPSALSRYQTLLERLIAKKPEQRFASATECIHALEASGEDPAAPIDADDSDGMTRILPKRDAEPVPSLEPSRQEAPVADPKPRRFFAFGLIGGAVLLLAGAGSLLALRWWPQRTPERSVLEQLPDAPRDRPETAVRYERLVIEHLDKGELEPGLEILRLGLAATPDDGRLAVLKRLILDRQEAARQLNEARRLLESDRIDDSLAAIARGLERVPDHAALLALRDMARQRAQALLRQSLDELTRQARQLFDEGQPDAALKLVEEGLQRLPDHPGLLELRAALRTALTRREQIAARIAEAREQLAADEIASSLETIARGLELDPDNRSLADLRATALKQQTQEAQRRIVSARQHEALDRCASLATDDRIRSGEIQAAANCYQAILTEDPGQETAQVRLQELETQAMAQLDRLIAANALDQAERALAALQSWRPDQPRIGPLGDLLRKRRELVPDLVPIRGGCFSMGSPVAEAGREADERPHQVCVRDFQLARLETTQAEFGRFVAATGYRTDAQRGFGGIAGCWALDHDHSAEPWRYQTWASWENPNKYQPALPTHPVSCVSVHDAAAYLAWLNRETGLQFRLPTEAEWEYAARAGTATAYVWGTDIDAEACRQFNAADRGSGWEEGFPCHDRQEWVAPVGQFAANPWGIQDLLGNLWEWSCSEYDPEYGGAEQSCPPALSELPRIMRGGAWNSAPAALRSAYRNRGFPEARYSFVGFRVAHDTLVPGEPRAVISRP